MGAALLEQFEQAMVGQGKTLGVQPLSPLGMRAPKAGAGCGDKAKQRGSANHAVPGCCVKSAADGLLGHICSGTVAMLGSRGRSHVSLPASDW